MTKEEFKKAYIDEVVECCAKPLDECSDLERYEALVSLISYRATEILAETTKRNSIEKPKKVYYFSMEFLIGKLLENYLINLGCKDVVEQGLREMGVELSDLLEVESDPGLGNGGLGRLAACFLDSMAAMGIPGMGMGLRFRFGLFRQRIISGYQIEEPDAWLENGYPWETVKTSGAVQVRFGGTIEKTFNDGKLGFIHKDGEVVLAVPYDVPIVGFDGRYTNILRLWQARNLHETVDFEAFNKGNYPMAMREKSRTEAITCILYPNDNSDTGKILRLKQEYLLCCAGLNSILQSYEASYGSDAWGELADHVAVHINDTHPALCVPELMRILVDEKKMEWDDAWEVTRNTIAFTNHTVLPEALERWPQEMLKELLPRIYMIIEEIDRRWKDSLRGRDDWHQLSTETAILADDQVRMAQLSVIGSHSVNGVAALHSKIIAEDLFRGFSALDPAKFSNKTNGISHRRFLIQSNPALSGLITEALGESWKREPGRMEELLRFSEDTGFLDAVARAKAENKQRLVDYISKTSHIAVDPQSVFDVQVKRIHAYKRQLLNALKILDIYNTLKDDPNADVKPATFIFSGKAAPGYAFAKEVIKFICSVADLVNSDPVIRERIKVVFIENFCVSNAQLIYPAADISEQISTAGKEASGTGNMKFMMNGAVTLGTLDGANVEIHGLVGDENIKIFGLTADETSGLAHSGAYRSQQVCDGDPTIKRMMDQLVNGTFSASGRNFWDIRDALLQYNDEYFVLKDLEPYRKAWRELTQTYQDSSAWNRMCLVNIAKSHFFSSDRTIDEYAKEIWKVSRR